MSTILVLKPRGDRANREIINEYFDYVLEKTTAMTTPNSPEDIERIESRRRTSLEQYGVKPESVHISEHVLWEYAAADSFNAFRELFPPSPTPSVVCEQRHLKKQPRHFEKRNGN